jgi:MoaA/NifB/PqqE/SkfB family radical SAM enzyme
MRWGKTKEDDPNYSEFGPEIVDIEISEVCTHGCTFCYKSNIKVGRNMSLDTYKEVLKKLPKTVTQIAFGIGDIDGNPDLFPILAAHKSRHRPNITFMDAD